MFEPEELTVDGTWTTIMGGWRYRDAHQTFRQRWPDKNHVLVPLGLWSDGTSPTVRRSLHPYVLVVLALKQPIRMQWLNKVFRSSPTWNCQ